MLEFTGSDEAWETSAKLLPGAVLKLSAMNPSNASLELGLLARASAGDPEVCRVLPLETRTIDVPSGQHLQMFSFGFAGCTGVSIISKHPDDKRSATISHRPPEEMATQLQELQAEIARHAPADPRVLRAIYIMMPGFHHEADGQVQLKPAQPELLGQLVKMLEAKLPGTKPTLISYHPFRKPEESDAFVLDVPADFGASIRYDGLHRGQCEL